MEQQMMEKRGRWWIAGLLSFLVPGLGQVYNGETTKGLFYSFLITTWGGVVFSLLYFILKHPITRLGCGVLFLLFFISLTAYLLIIFESIRSALKKGPGRVFHRYHSWAVYTLVILIVSGVDQSVSTAVRDNILMAYKIPSRSMQPTIEAGDHVICNRLYYRYNNPERGDLIIFQSPGDEKMEYIKRIVGIPGDTIELRDETLWVNGLAVEEPYAEYGAEADRSWETSGNFGPVVVSENEYFVMGDNRNNSQDSRVFGAVKRQKIQGKAVFIYFSWSMDVPSWNLPRRLFSIRFSRIGKIL